MNFRSDHVGVGTREPTIEQTNIKYRVSLWESRMLAKTHGPGVPRSEAPELTPSEGSTDHVVVASKGWSFTDVRRTSIGRHLWGRFVIIDRLAQTKWIQSTTTYGPIYNDHTVTVVNPSTRPLVRKDLSVWYYDNIN